VSKKFLSLYNSAKIIKIDWDFPKLRSQMYCHLFMAGSVDMWRNLVLMCWCWWLTVGRCNLLLWCTFDIYSSQTSVTALSRTQLKKLAISEAMHCHLKPLTAPVVLRFNCEVHNLNSIFADLKCIDIPNFSKIPPSVASFRGGMD